MKIGILGPVTTSKYFGGVAIFDEEIANGFEQNNCQVVLLTDQKEEKINKDKFNIKKINLSINIGTENASLTALLVAIISSITGIVFRKSIIDSKKQSFRIVPVYINKNLINIAVSGIFEIKMIHIINIMYVLNKKKGVKKNERTSNRRTYDYSYE